jgi:hypothetical protein
MFSYQIQYGHFTGTAHQEAFIFFLDVLNFGNQRGTEEE